MKYRRFLIFITAIVVCFAILGIVSRLHYTNITANENYMDQLVVGELPGQLCSDNFQRMSQELHNAPIILRVTAVDEMENFFYYCRQKVAVREVYAGNGLTVGDEFYLTSAYWALLLSPDEYSAQRGFVNILRIGSDYLVFIQSEISTPLMESETPTYQLYDQFLSTPIFCYEEIENKIVMPSQKGKTYVPYTEVKDNEFFVTTEEGNQAFLALKAELLARYPAHE